MLGKLYSFRSKEREQVQLVFRKLHPETRGLKDRWMDTRPIMQG